MQYSVAHFNSIAQAFFAIAARHPDGIAYSQAARRADEEEDRAKPRPWRKATYRECAERVKKIIGYLESIGLDRGAKAAILSGTRPEWLEADIAILSLGAISVSIYQSLPADNVAYILFDSGAQVIFAENQEQVDKLLEIAAEPSYIPGHEDRAETTAQVSIRRIIAFEPVAKHPLVVQLQWITEGAFPSVNSGFRSLARDETASIVYTSGTTGPPKGVIQSHGNHLANIRQGCSTGLVDEQSVLFLFLPLAHSFARLLAYIGFLTPAELRFPAVCNPACSTVDKESMMKDMRESGAEIIPVVPRILEKIQEKMLRAASKGTAQGILLRTLISTARKHYTACISGRMQPGAAVLFRLSAGLRRRLRAKLFGPNLRFIICGAAKLAPDTAEFFEALEIEVVEGYGLTESCVANTISRPGSKRLSSVGKPLADEIEIRVSEEGEVFVRGPHVARGYYQRPTATRQTWDEEGWLHTGDLGRLDEEGNLFIIGRKKEILVSSNGKKIASFDVEKRINASPLIGGSVLVGEGRPYCTAVLSLEPGGVRRWAAEKGIALPEEPHTNDLLLNEIEQHIARCNKHLANFEAVQKYFIAPEPFSVENGLLTPTMKVKRSAVLERYKAEVDKLYQGRGA